MNIKKQFLVILVLLVSGSALFAHPPKAITLKYDIDSKTLDVIIIHKSKNITRHYIDEIRVFINKEERILQKFKAQTDEYRQVVSYILPDMALNTRITVMVKCSVYGSDKESIYIEEVREKDKE